MILVGRGPTTFVTICGIIVDMTLLTRFRSDNTSRYRLYDLYNH